MSFELYFSGRKTSHFSACMMTVQYIVFAAKRITAKKCHSYFVLGIYMLFTGKIKDFRNFLISDSEFYVDSTLFSAFSAVFFVLFAVLIVLTFKNIGDELRLHSKRKRINMNVILSALPKIMLVVLMLFSVSAAGAHFLYPADLISDDSCVFEGSEKADKTFSYIGTYDDNYCSYFTFDLVNSPEEGLPDEITFYNRVKSREKTDISFMNIKTER